LHKGEHKLFNLIDRAKGGSARAPLQWCGLLSAR
jgi:hypothetical protein